MMTRTRILVLLTLGLTIIVCSTPYLVYELPYQQFITAERTAYPLFAELDRKVYEQFPPPDGVEILEKTDVESFSESGYHGHMIHVEYSVDSSQVSLEDIKLYYEKLLESKGWLPLVGKNAYGLGYYHGTSCFTLSKLLDSYIIRISHDFEGQSFSPKLPPTWVIFFHEMKYDGTYIEECP
jgi:hypothetical protein